MLRLLVPALDSVPALPAPGPFTVSALPAGLCTVTAVPEASVLFTTALFAASVKVGAVTVNGELLIVSVTPPTETVPLLALQFTAPAAPASNV